MLLKQSLINANRILFVGLFLLGFKAFAQQSDQDANPFKGVECSTKDRYKYDDGTFYRSELKILPIGSSELYSVMNVDYHGEWTAAQGEFNIEYTLNFVNSGYICFGVAPVAYCQLEEPKNKTSKGLGEIFLRKSLQYNPFIGEGIVEEYFKAEFNNPFYDPAADPQAQENIGKEVNVRFWYSTGFSSKGGYCNFL